MIHSVFDVNTTAIILFLISDVSQIYGTYYGYLIKIYDSDIRSKMALDLTLSVLTVSLYIL